MESAADRRVRRLGWFRAGAHALGCVVAPRPPDAYLCPICLEFFAVEKLTSGDLTDEHVPPRSVGGNPLVLTCKDCNAKSGHTLDEAMANEEKWRTFGRPHALGTVPATVVFEARRNNGALRFDGETFLMAGDPGQNSPGAIEAHREAMDLFGKGSVLELQIRVKRDPKRAAIGWLRSAYLAAFAVYGYRYILQPAFEDVRVALGGEVRGPFTPIILRIPDDGPLTPAVWQVISPEMVDGCRAVTFGPRLVLLPPWDAPEDWWTAVARQLDEIKPSQLRMRPALSLRFPREPMHLLDG